MSIENDQSGGRELAEIKDNRNEIEGKSSQDVLQCDEDLLCGMGGWKPAWLQKFATAPFFVANFSIVAILQGAVFTYMVSIVSTLEKRYAFDAKVSGFILISDNISEMFLSPVVGYLGSNYNRSKLIALGELIVALSCFLAAVPYFMYGPGLHLLSKQMGPLNVTGDFNNQTQFDLCITKDGLDTCSTNEGVDAGWWMKYLSVPVLILWVSHFANGCGYIAFFTIGVPYLDDNIKKKNSPIYLSSITTLRMLGPMLGYVLASFSLSFYENPFIDPGITNRDPRWIGAWWLGFVILGFGMLIFSIPMFCFPKILAREFKQPSHKKLENMLKDAWNSLKRLACNEVLVCHKISGILRVIGYLGYYIIKPKYMELQFRQSASSASFFTGATSVISMAIGTMAGGMLIKKYRPKAQTLAILIVSVELYSALNILIASFLKCPAPTFEGLDWIDQPSMSSCSGGCECSTKVYQPVCAADGLTNYFSPCFAGCKSYNSIVNSTKLAFSDCSCLASNFSLASSAPILPVPSPTWQAVSGLCERSCNMFTYFVALHAFSNLIGSLTRTGDLFLMLRCVEPRDKSFALGVSGTLFAIFAFIPYPLIFGVIVDSTCLIWEKTCGRPGNCWLYDMEKFRIYLHYGSLAFLVVGLFFEVGTVMYASKVKNLYDEEDDDKGVEERVEMDAS